MKSSSSSSTRFLSISLVASFLLIAVSLVPLDGMVKDALIAIALLANVFVLAFVLLGLLFSQKPWLVKAVCFFKKDAFPVQLIDFVGDTYTTIAVPADDGYHANVYWFTSVGQCNLRKNGTVDPDSDSSFVYFWMPISRSKRIEHVLSNDIPDFSALDGLSKKQRAAFMRKEFDARNAT